MGESIQSVLGVDGITLNPKPFPHLVTDGFFKTEFFDQLKSEFPNITKKKLRRGWGQSLYPGDDAYDDFLQTSPAWKRLYEIVHSQSFIDYIINEFGEHWAREGCTVDLSKAKYIPYIEERADKELIFPAHQPNAPEEFFCRLDLYQSWAGYYRPVHLDHRRRLITMLVYFDDPEEIGMEGGELILHAPALDLTLMNKLKLYHAPKLYSQMRDRFAKTVCVYPGPNRMAIFPCGKRSWHSVPTIQTKHAPRQHIQICISSQHRIWS